MEIKLLRREFSYQSTIGDWIMNGVFVCFVLEPKDRGLHSEMSLEEILKIKVPGKTAIPYSRYKIEMVFSPEFKMYVPIYRDVKGFGAVEFHIGNRPADTHACSLPGLSKQKDCVLHSTAAFNIVVPQIQKAIDNKEEVWLTIEKAKENVTIRP